MGAVRPLPKCPARFTGSRQNRFWLLGANCPATINKGKHKWKQYWCWSLGWCSQTADQWKMFETPRPFCGIAVTLLPSA